MSLTPATAPLDQSGELARLAAQLKDQVRPVLRDTLLAALRSMPKDVTCGDCTRCYTQSDTDKFGRCSAFPPVSFVVDGKVTSRDPIVNFDRAACVLWQELSQ
jgi:hypothetical protein